MQKYKVLVYEMKPRGHSGGAIQREIWEAIREAIQGEIRGATGGHRGGASGGTSVGQFGGSGREGGIGRGEDISL